MSSTTSNNSLTASSSIISPHEFSRLITEPEMTRSLARAFASRPTSTAILCYYFFLSRSIDRLEQDLERHRHEQNTLFDHLFKSRRFRMKVEPIIQRYRQPTPRYHPYGHTPSPPGTPSDNNDINLPSNTAIDEEIGSKQNPIIIPDDEETHVGTFKRQKTRRYRFHPSTRSMSVPSYRQTPSPIDDHIQQRRRSLNGSQSPHQPNDEEPGTKWNPIYVSENNVIRCGLCNEEGHFILDCTKEYWFDEENRWYAPIPDTGIPDALRYTVNTGEDTQGHFMQ